MSAAVQDEAGPDETGQEPATRTPPSRLPLTTELARVTGLLLVVLLPIHLVTVLLAEPTDVDALLARWEQRGWLLADWGFLTVGLAHGVLSIRARLLGRFGDAGQLAYRVVVILTAVGYLAACWAMLRLI